MSRKILIYPLLILTLIQNGITQAADKIPEIIDIPTMSKWHGYFSDSSDKELYKLGILAFNGAPEVFSIIASLKRMYNIEDAVETGTFKGYTTVLLSSIFENVYSVELNKNNYDDAMKFLEEFKNIKLILGSSEDTLNKLLPSLKAKKLLFYLDAHWHDYWPILDELDAISKTHKDNCIIVIDDVLVPGRSDVAFDKYKRQPLSYEYVKAKLDNIFTNYSVHYIISNVNKIPHAQMVLIPEIGNLR